MTLQLHILRQLAASVAFAVTGVSLIVVPTSFVSAIQKLGPVSLGSAIAYVPFALVDIAPYLLPLAFLIGVVATYGRLAADNEWLAAQFAGVHPARLVLPAALIASAFAGWTFYFLTDFAPHAKYESRNYLREKAVEAFKDLGSRSGDLEFGNSSLTSRSSYGNVREGVLLDLREEKGKEMTVTADRATLGIHYDEKLEDDVLTIEFENARVLGKNSRVFGEFPFCAFPLEEIFPVVRMDRSRAKYFSNGEIRAVLADDDSDAATRDEFEFELHRRSALSLSFFLLLLVGVPTGIALRSSTQLAAFSGAIAYGLLYFVVALQLGKLLFDSGSVPPSLAAWAPNLAFGAVGAVLSYRTLFR